MKTKEQIKQWLNEKCNINDYDGAIALSEVVDILHRFQSEVDPPDKPPHP